MDLKHTAEGFQKVRCSQGNPNKLFEWSTMSGIAKGVRLLDLCGTDTCELVDLKHTAEGLRKGEVQPI